MKKLILTTILSLLLTTSAWAVQTAYPESDASSTGWTTPVWDVTNEPVLPEASDDDFTESDGGTGDNFEVNLQTINAPSDGGATCQLAIRHIRTGSKKGENFTYSLEDGGTVLYSGSVGAGDAWTETIIPADLSGFTIGNWSLEVVINVTQADAGEGVRVSEIRLQNCADAGGGDTTSPSVSTTTPNNGATGVTLDSNVTIVFDEEIACGTVDTSSITSTSPGWTFDSCNVDTVVFTTSGQVNDTLYNVNVTSSVQDLAGNPANTYAFSYRTEVVVAGTPPSINNPTSTGIGDNQATLGANITDLGDSAVTARGVVWSLSANPTLSSNIGFTDTPPPAISTGTFSSIVSGLPAGTLIHYRGYATNDTSTVYTVDDTFTTTGAVALIGHNYDVNGGVTLDCSTCHAFHGAFSVPSGAEVYSACTQCHSSTGSATAWDVANHIVTKESENALEPQPTYTIDCGMCHEIHKSDLLSDASEFTSGGGTARNDKYVRVNMSKYLPSAQTNTVFQVNPDHFAEWEGAGVGTTLNGVCQSCHTDTKYHKNTEIGSDHKLSGDPNTTDCMSCHAHGTGVEEDNPTGSAFAASGGHGANDTAVVGIADCTACHAMPTLNPVTEIHGDNCQYCHDNPSGGGPLVSYLVGIGVTNPADCVECHEFSASTATESRDGHHGYKTILSSKVTKGRAMNGTCVDCHEPDVGQGSTRADLVMPPNLACNFCHLWWPNNKGYWTATDTGYGTTGTKVNIYSLTWSPNAKTYAGSTVLTTHGVSENTVTPISDYAACFACHGKTAATKGGGKQVRPFHGLGGPPTTYEPMTGDSGSADVMIMFYAGPDGSGQSQPKRNDMRHPGFGAFNHLGEDDSGTNLVRPPVDGGHQFGTDTRKAHDPDEATIIRSNAVTSIKSGEFNVPWDGYDAGIVSGPQPSDPLNTGGQSGEFTTPTKVPLVYLSLPDDITP